MQTTASPSPKRTEPASGRRRVLMGARRNWVEVLCVVAIVVLATTVRYPTLQQPLVEVHGFRQTQTAYTARIFHEQGIDLLHPQLPVLGEPWEVPFEFPLFQALASVTMSFGLDPDPALRVTGLATFLLTSLLVWGLVRFVTRKRVAAAAALVAFSFSPFALVWSRASMIEYLATAGAVGFAFAGILWLNTRRLVWAVTALGAGVLGMLVKPTTGAFWVLPILGWGAGQPHLRNWVGLVRKMSPWARRTLRPEFLAVLGLPYLGALLWTRHADAIKEASPLTEWLTEGALREWNYGTIDQRLALDNWLVVLNRAEDLLVGPVLWGGLLLLPFIAGQRRWFWVGVLLTAILPVAVFFNLYLVHDYYLAAASPAIAMLLGSGVGWIHDRVKERFGPVSALVGTLILTAGWLASILSTTAPYWRSAYGKVKGSSLAVEVPDVTGTEDRLVVVGLDWSPHLLYYAHRRGLMLTPHLDPTKTVEELRRRGYEYFVALDPGNDPVHHLRGWPWIGVVSEHVYRVGNRPSDVGPAAVMASSDPEEFTRIASSSKELTAGPISVDCGAPVSFLRGSVATWIHLGAAENDAARIWLGSGLAPLPEVDTIAVPTAEPEEPLTLLCTGVESLQIESVVSGPMPGALGSD